jgi:hypothetical protein
MVSVRTFTLFSNAAFALVRTALLSFWNSRRCRLHHHLELGIHFLRISAKSPRFFVVKQCAVAEDVVGAVDMTEGELPDVGWSSWWLVEWLK